MKTILTLLLLNFLIAKSFSQNTTWVDGMGGTGDNSGTSVTTDASGNVYTTGYFMGAADFDPGAGVYTITATDSTDIFISKVDASGNFQWSKSIGGIGDDRGRSICTDPSGNVYITGSFSGTIDLDPGAGTNTVTSVGMTDIFILKMDNNGNLIWAKSIGGSTADYGSSIVLDGAGNIYTTGRFMIAADFDPGAGVFNLNVQGSAMFVLKLDASGNFVWAKAVGCPNQQGLAIEPTAIALDAAQNIYTTGYFIGSADFDPGVGSYTLMTSWQNTDWNIQTYICKLSASGNFIWARRFEGNTNSGLGLALDAFANIYLGGYFAGANDLDPGPAVFTLTPAYYGYDNGYVVKLDSAGNFNWARSFGGTDHAAVAALTLDPSGNIYAAGIFKATADFDPGPAVYTFTSVGGFDAVITRLDASGNFISAKKFGGPADDFGYSIALDAFGNILLSGSFGGTCDFDSVPGLSNLTAVGRSDVFVLKLGNCVMNITSQPSDQTLLVGGTAQFVTSAAGAPLFQWQQNSGSGFVNLSNTGQYSGTATATLTVSNLLLAQNNFSFRCVVTQSTCATSSDYAVLHIYDPTGIKANSSENRFLIYPNPAKDLIKVKISEQLKGSSYTLIDQTGRILLEGNLSSEVSTLNLSAFAAGMYFLKVNSLKQEMMKVIKE